MFVNIVLWLLKQKKKTFIVNMKIYHNILDAALF